MTRFSEIAENIERQYDPDFDMDRGKTAPRVSFIDYWLLELCQLLDARLTALEGDKPQTPAASCDEMLDTLLLSNADKRAAIANLTAQRNALAAQVDDLTRRHESAWYAFDVAVIQNDRKEHELMEERAERNALAAQVDDLRNINAGLRIALSDPAPCTGTGSGGCDCLPDDEA